MENTRQEKKQLFTKEDISRLLKTKLDVCEIKASTCKKVCWSGNRENYRFDVKLEDVEVGGNLDCPAIFKLRICDVTTKNREMISLAIRYCFHIEVDTDTLSIEEVAALVNDMNMAPAHVKTVLLNVTDTGYGFCSEGRFNITSIDDILECYNAVRFHVQRAASNAIKKVNYYLRNKNQFDWEKRSVERGDIEKFDNCFKLTDSQMVTRQPHYMITDSMSDDDVWYLRGLNNEIDNNWRGAIACYRKVVEGNGFNTDVARWRISEVFDKKLRDYKMAEMWRMFYDTELDIEMLLRRNLWQRAFVQAKRDVEDNLEALEGLLVEAYDERDENDFWHEMFTNHSVDLLCAINDYLKVLRKANVELNGGDLFNYEKWLDSILKSIGEFYVIEENEPQGNSKPTEEVEIWPPIPQGYPYDEEHWHRELEERARSAKQLS